MVIKAVIITFLLQITFNGVHSDYQNGAIKMSHVNIRNVCNSTKPCIWKCCPVGTHMRLTRCQSSSLRFGHNITVYNKEFEATNKSLEDAFELVHGIMEDSTFHDNSLNLMILKFNMYLLEDGTLYYEMPNMFDRWNKIETDHFCVDLESKRTIKPVFRVEIKEDTDFYADPTFDDTLGMTISVFFITLTIIPYAWLPKLRDVNGIMLIFFLISFAFHLLVRFWIVTSLMTQKEAIAKAILYYFCLVSSFCSTTVMFYRIRSKSARMSSNASRPVGRSDIKPLLKYIGYTYAVTIFLTKIVLVTELKDLTSVPWFITPQIVKNDNILFTEKESLLYLYIPLACFLTYNWKICIQNIIELYRESKENLIKPNRNEEDLKSPLNRPLQYLGLLIPLTVYCFIRVLNVIVKKDVIMISVVMGPILFITFVANRNVLKIAKEYYSKRNNNNAM